MATKTKILDLDRPIRTSRRAPPFSGQISEFSASRLDHERNIALLADHLAHRYNVLIDGVAFLALDRQGHNLSFVAPEHLARIRAKLPFDRMRSLAGRALWDRKPYIENHVVLGNHLSRLDPFRSVGQSPTRTEKLLTYPLHVMGSPIGVVQISRKITIQQPFRPGFNRKDILYLAELEPVLLKLLQGIRSSRRESSAA